ncbi:MAG: FkbM family methyltransferase [Alphaproteobacteria bacterium]|nr:FkbM family methyltransferase [Alphaproteobacteria bacterium]MBF0332462.1 FkbM family methyltransferase [Alphaproteobacteria bacterium]
MTLEEVLRRAFDYHLRGEIEAARTLYELVRRKVPNHPLVNGLHQIVSGAEIWAKRQTMAGTLSNLKARGFAPNTIIDVGAQQGTPPLYDVFPDARLLMIEPVAENEPALRALAASLPRAELILAAAGRKDGMGVLSVLMQGRFSRISEEGVAGQGQDARQMVVRRVDTLAKERDTTGPYLIKIDVDGTELAVIDGCAALVDEHSVFVVEAVLAGRASPFLELMFAFDKLDFIPIDIVDPLIRPKDGGLWQVDAVFAHRNSPYVIMDGFWG